MRSPNANLNTQPSLPTMQCHDGIPHNLFQAVCDRHFSKELPRLHRDSDTLTPNAIKIDLNDFINIDLLTFAGPEWFEGDAESVFNIVRNDKTFKALNMRITPPVGTRLYCSDDTRFDNETVVCEVIPAVSSHPNSGREIMVLTGKYAGAHACSPSVICGLIHYEKYKGKTHSNGYRDLYFSANHIGDGTLSERASGLLDEDLHFPVVRERLTEVNGKEVLLISNHYIRGAAHHLFDEHIPIFKDNGVTECGCYRYIDFAAFCFYSRVIQNTKEELGVTVGDVGDDEIDEITISTPAQETPVAEEQGKPLTQEENLELLHMNAQQSLRDLEKALGDVGDRVTDSRPIGEARVSLLKLRNKLYEIFGAVSVSISFTSAIEVSEP